jgi:hypothetical protein
VPGWWLERTRAAMSMSHGGWRGHEQPWQCLMVAGEDTSSHDNVSWWLERTRAAMTMSPSFSCFATQEVVDQGTQFLN